MNGTFRTFPRRFHDRLGFEPQTTRDILRILTTGGFNDPGSQLPLGREVRRVAPRVPAAPRGVAVTWIGHASFLVQLGGSALLVDPVMSEKIPGGVRRANAPGLAWTDLPDLAGVLISHNHYDHLDAPTLKRLPRDVPVVVPAKVGAWFRAKGFTRVTELDWWEHVALDGATVELVPAQHWSRRGPFDRNATLWGGFVAWSDRGKAYVAGDSGYCAWFREIGSRHPDLDVALLPIGAYEPAWFMQRVHMNPEEAVQAFEDVGARRLVPMHWGTFPLTREVLLEPRERLLAEWSRLKLAEDDLWDLALGETRVAHESPS